jgi:hypothetical protein
MMIIILKMINLIADAINIITKWIINTIEMMILTNDTINLMSRVINSMAKAIINVVNLIIYSVLAFDFPIK